MNSTGRVAGASSLWPEVVSLALGLGKKGLSYEESPLWETASIYQVGLAQRKPL